VRICSGFVQADGGSPNLVGPQPGIAERRKATQVGFGVLSKANSMRNAEGLVDKVFKVRWFCQKVRFFFNRQFLFYLGGCGFSYPYLLFFICFVKGSLTTLYRFGCMIVFIKRNESLFRVYAIFWVSPVVRENSEPNYRCMEPWCDPAMNKLMVWREKRRILGYVFA
jgi:hypothetical protein